MKSLSIDKLRSLQQCVTERGALAGFALDHQGNLHRTLNPNASCNVLYLPVLQLMAYYRSIAKGLNSDRPTHLTAVVTLDLSE